MFLDYLVFEISVNSNGAHIGKREKHKTFVPFYVLLSFVVSINTDSNVQTGVTFF